jgi:ATP adenylyltransferase
MKDCIFCKIYKEKIGIIFENEFFFCQFDKYPVSPGHAEVIPKRHLPSLFDLSKDEWYNLQSAISDVVKIIEKTNLQKLYQNFIDFPLDPKSVKFCNTILNFSYLNQKPDAYNIGVNEGTAAGRTVDHLHIHIIPRFFGDVEDYVGGIRHIIPGLGNYKNSN